ncbi:MAG: diaminopimelate epimerase [Thermodesulfobacteriota bacterium]|nr:diaminopimelate epimerase [Thermodesulfobacteriota bacterium]
MTETDISFFKMSGSGNDFIIVDNRDRMVGDEGLGPWIASVCRRKHSVGADGLILIERADKADFRWRYFNADGGEVEMCGNGGRCAARFALLKGIAGPRLRFETMAGVIQAEVTGERVKLEMPAPSAPQLDYRLEVEGETLTVSSITVGVPHVVTWVEDLEAAPVVRLGRAIRYHGHYAPAGTNANFVQPLEDGTLAIRTYERGVEDETLACGTGSVASALIAASKGLVTPPVVLHTRGGERLRIHFKGEGSGGSPVFLEGDAKVIYEGRLWKEAVS